MSRIDSSISHADRLVLRPVASARESLSSVIEGLVEGSVWVAAAGLPLTMAAASFLAR